MPRVERRGRHLLLDGRPIYVRSGEIQYWRVPREHWARVLDRAVEGGLNCVATGVPWFWHEPEEGRFDFTGQTHPQRDLLGQPGLWHAWLLGTYGSLERLNERYATSAAQLTDLQPPRDKLAGVAGRRQMLDWLRFKEWHIFEYARYLGRRLREHGLTVPYALNEPVNILWGGPGDHGPCVLKLALGHGLDGYNHYMYASALSRAGVSTLGRDYGWDAPVSAEGESRGAYVLGDDSVTRLHVRKGGVLRTFPLLSELEVYPKSAYLLWLDLPLGGTVVRHCTSELTCRPDGGLQLRGDVGTRGEIALADRVDVRLDGQALPLVEHAGLWIGTYPHGRHPATLAFG